MTVPAAFFVLPSRCEIPPKQAIDGRNCARGSGSAQLLPRSLTVESTDRVGASKLPL